MAALKNQRWEKFARGVAKGLSNGEAYRKAGYKVSPDGRGGSDVSASRLLRNAKIRARVDELTEKVTEKVIEVSIADRKNRLAALNERWQLMAQIRSERAAEMTKKDGKPVVAGASTGMLARTFKTVGTGQNQRIVPEFTFDAALFKEMRACEEHAAKESGQWLEKVEKDSGAAKIIEGMIDLWRKGPQAANTVDAADKDGEE